VAGRTPYFRSWGQTGCAIRLAATAALDPTQTFGRLDLHCNIAYLRHGFIALWTV